MESGKLPWESDIHEYTCWVTLSSCCSSHLHTGNWTSEIPEQLGFKISHRYLSFLPTGDPSFSSPPFYPDWTQTAFLCWQEEEQIPLRIQKAQLGIWDIYGPMWPGEEGNEVSEKATGAADSLLGHNFLRLYVIVGYRSHSEFKELKNGHYLSWVLVSTLLSKSCVISESYAQLVVPWLYLL